MPGDVRRDRHEEARDVADLLVGVVEAGDQQRHDLEPEPPGVQEPDGVEHGLQHASQLPVALVVEPLEVDLVEVHPRADVVEDLRGRVAVGDVGAGEPARVARLEHLHRPLAGDQGLVVGGGEDARPVAEGGVHDLVRGDFLGLDAHRRVA